MKSEMAASFAQCQKTCVNMRRQYSTHGISMRSCCEFLVPILERADTHRDRIIASATMAVITAIAAIARAPGMRDDNHRSRRFPKEFLNSTMNFPCFQIFSYIFERGVSGTMRRASK